MRGVHTFINDIRRQVFTEVARLAFEGGDYAKAIEHLPYKIIPGEVARHRQNIFLERAIVSERIRLAIGLPLREVDEHTPTSANIEESAIAQKYYEPPLINIINFACNACPPKQYRITEYARAAWPTPVGGLPQGRHSLVKARAISTRPSASSAASVPTSAPMARS